MEGIRGWAGDHVTVIQSVDDAENFIPGEKEKLCIVSQTTFNYNKFKDLVEIIKKKSYDVSVLNTICNATKSVRQRRKALRNRWML